MPSFQFSLWDSRNGTSSAMLPDLSLSILFMRFRDERGRKIIGFYNFQFSLWDSLKMNMNSLGLRHFFQFSLWDSTCKFFTLFFTNVSYLSILFMRFLLIKEAKYIGIHNLSILFMRFINYGIERVSVSIVWTFNSLYEILYSLHL